MEKSLTPASVHRHALSVDTNVAVSSGMWWQINVLRTTFSVIMGLSLKFIQLARERAVIGEKRCLQKNVPQSILLMHVHLMEFVAQMQMEIEW